MDKEAFFSAVKLKSRAVRVPGTEIELTLQELSAGGREELFSLCTGKGPHYIAAVAVALSCPDFTLDDVDRLLTEVNAEALMKLSEQVFDLSGVSDDAVDDAKKD